jgi:transcriptional regulator with XRE-family HTH domain/DNA-binding phage protein
MARTSPRPSLQDRLRSAIEGWSLSLRALALSADVGYSELRRFHLRRGGVSIATAEKLFRALGREVIAVGIAAAIRAAIEADPRGRRKLASDAGVHPQTVWRLKGGGGISLETADKILAALPDPPELVRERKAIPLAAMATDGRDGGPISDAIRPILAKAAERSDEALRRCGIDASQIRRALAGDLDLKLATAARIIGSLGFALRLGKPAEGWTPRAGQVEFREAIAASRVATNRISRLSGVALQTIRNYLDGLVDVRVSTADRVAFSLAIDAVAVELPSPLATDAVDASGSLAARVRERFKASGRSANAVARAAGLAGPTIGRFMAGGHTQPATLARIAAALEVELGASPAGATSDPPCPIVLKGEGRPPIVSREPIPIPLTPAEYHVLGRLAAAWVDGRRLTYEELAGPVGSADRVESPRKVIATMSRKPGYGPIVARIHKSGGRPQFLSLIEPTDVDK